MCGRYALALRPSQVRQILMEQGMPVADAPEDEGPGAPRQSYNFAPGYHGIVYRADTSDRGAGPRGDAPASVGEDASKVTDMGNSVTYKLQSMKWGLIPFWTKRNPEYGTIMRSINCRDDSLSTPGGMWATMKARKRCVVIAEGFFEWLKTGPKDKLPHYIKRKDQQLMCFAGLWDSAQFEDSDEKTYSYTIITTDSNRQMRFLHDRMPVILEPGSDALRTWLDPQRYEWSRDLQSLLKPFNGDLDIYPVSKDVGKVGNNSPSFIIPLDSKDNKSNIANFFANASKPPAADGARSPLDSPAGTTDTLSESPNCQAVTEKTYTAKRKVLEINDHADPPAKRPTVSSMSKPAAAGESHSKKTSPTRNKGKSPSKGKSLGSQKITNFFANT